MQEFDRAHPRLMFATINTQTYLGFGYIAGEFLRLTAFASLMDGDKAAAGMSCMRSTGSAEQIDLWVKHNLCLLAPHAQISASLKNAIVIYECDQRVWSEVFERIASGNQTEPAMPIKESRP